MNAPIRSHNPASVFPPYRNYAHAVEVPSSARTLYISGLNGYDETGEVLPDDFVGQATNVWTHLGSILADADMSYSDLVSIRFFLASADLDVANVEVIATHLGDHITARTVVVQQLLEPDWLIEVEAIAAKTS